VSGRSEAAGFIQVPWVREQLSHLLGQPPFPGTLNLRLARPEAVASWAGLRASGACLPLPPGEPGFCPASFYPVTVNGSVFAGVVLPHVAEYPEDVVEVVAAESLRERFGLDDDDPVELTW
jgi:CTP-dependent riboflavin kinase